MDGAGPLVSFFFVTIPAITPAIFFSLIINLIALFGGVILLDRGNTFSNGSSPFDGYIRFLDVRLVGCRLCCDIGMGLSI